MSNSLRIPSCLVPGDLASEGRGALPPTILKLVRQSEASLKIYSNFYRAGKTYPSSGAFGPILMLQNNIQEPDFSAISASVFSRITSGKIVNELKCCLFSLTTACAQYALAKIVRRPLIC